MKNAMKILVGVWVLSLAVVSPSYGQAVPAGNTTISSTGSNPNLPPLDGILHYSMTASEQRPIRVLRVRRDDFFDRLVRKCFRLRRRARTKPFSTCLPGDCCCPTDRARDFQRFGMSRCRKELLGGVGRRPSRTHSVFCHSRRRPGCRAFRVWGIWEPNRCKDLPQGREAEF